MNTEKILKKLKEIQVAAINKLHSDDKESQLQVADKEKLPNEELVGGEEVKIKRPKAENVKVPDSLSRTTPMAGPTKFNTPEEVYTSGEKKSVTIESIQAQLDDLKKDMDADRWGGELGTLLMRAEAYLTEHEQNKRQGRVKYDQRDIDELRLEINRNPPSPSNIKNVLARFP